MLFSDVQQILHTTVVIELPLLGVIRFNVQLRLVMYSSSVSLFGIAMVANSMILVFS